MEVCHFNCHIASLGTTLKLSLHTLEAQNLVMELNRIVQCTCRFNLMTKILDSTYLQNIHLLDH